MWSSTLPTGTVRNEGRSSRTYPQSTPQLAAPNRPSPQDDRSDDQRDQSEREAELERLREHNRRAGAEIERLESQVDELQRKLADQSQAQQAIVDRYEQLISELESAATTAPKRTTTTTEIGFADRLRRWFSN